MVIAAPVQKTLLTPSGFVVAQVDSPVGHVRPVRHDVARVLAAPGEDDQADRQRDDQRIQPQHADEDAVDEAHEHADAESGEDRDRELVVRARSDPRRSGFRRGHHPGRRQVDAPLNDHEHLPERRDREDGRVREDVRPRGVPQGVRRRNRSDDEEYAGGQPDREEARGDRGVRGESSNVGGRESSRRGRRWWAGRNHGPFSPGPANSVNDGLTTVDRNTRTPPLSNHLRSCLSPLTSPGRKRLWSLYMRRRENHRTEFLSEEAKE